MKQATTKYLLLTIWSLVCAIILASLIADYYFVCDDAFISFSYARNLIEGNGLVFNIGERVEGYTNFLWVLISSVGIGLGAPPDIWANSLSIFFTYVLLAGALTLVIRQTGSTDGLLIAAIAILYLSVNRSFAVWSTSGLETRFFTLMLFLAFVTSPILTRGKRWLAVSSCLFALAALIRMEACLFYGEITLVAALQRGGMRNWKLRDFAAWILPIVTLYGIYELFRLLYFGYPLPNTFYAKVTGAHFSLGLDYLFAFGMEYQLAVIIPIILLGVIGRQKFGSRIGMLLLLFIPYLAYLAYIGGDHFEYRMLDILLPFLAIGIGLGAVRLKNLFRSVWVRTASLAAIVVLVIFAATAIPTYSRDSMPPVYTVASVPGVDFNRHMWLTSLPGFSSYCDTYSAVYENLVWHLGAIRAEEHRLFYRKQKSQADILAYYIREGIIEPDPTISLLSVGTIPYVTRLRTVDYLGLTDSTVAHHGQSAEKTFGRRPIAHERNASMDYLYEREVDYIWSLGYGFFAVDPPYGKVLPQSYIVRLPNHYFAFRTSKPEPEVLSLYGEFPVMFLDANGQLRSLRP